jgi:hypothetical protein
MPATGFCPELAKSYYIYNTVFFYRDFDDHHTNSIDEPYYRSVVLQHGIAPDCYVLLVPFDAGNQSITTVKI